MPGESLTDHLAAVAAAHQSAFDAVDTAVAAASKQLDSERATAQAKWPTQSAQAKPNE